MADWTVPATVLAVGTGLTVLTTYIVYKAQIEKTRNRIFALEREIAKARIREEINQKRLAKILETVVELRETIDNEFVQLREKLDKLIAESFVQKTRSAA
jgi:dephospho-CoA kinase